MVAEIKEYSERAGRNTTELGGRAEIIEDFYWRIDEGSKPELLRVRPHVIARQELANIDRVVAEAGVYREQVNLLIAKRAPLETEIFMESLDKKSDAETNAQRKLRLLNAKIAELEQHPSPAAIMAELFFTRVIVSWPFTLNGVPVPLTVEGVQSLDPIFLDSLRDDLVDFFYGETRKKNKS